MSSDGYRAQAEAERAAPWVRPSGWARFVFTAVILLQVAIPGSAALLHLRDPHQWAWSMFSGYQISYYFYLETAVGSVSADPLEAGRFTGRIGYTEAIPRRLCAKHPEASAVLRQRRVSATYYDRKGFVSIVRFPCAG